MITETISNTSMNITTEKDKKYNKNNDISFKPSLYFVVNCVFLFIIIIIFIISIINVNKEHKFSVPSRVKYKDDTIIKSNIYND